MRVRLFELRLLAIVLFALWSGTFALVAVGYHPGGPYDALVAAAALLPSIVAAVAVLWPPLARGDRAAAAIGWLGIIAALLLVPSVASLAAPLLGSTPGQTILPAPEVAYAGLLALFATCLFAGLGLARELLGETAVRRRRLVVGTILALGLTSLVGTSFGAAAVANDAALRDRVLPPSAWGPTDPKAVPPACDGPLTIGPEAKVSETASAHAGSSSVGHVSLDGARSGEDERWTATLTLGSATSTLAYVRVGSQAWSRSGQGAWTLEGNAGQTASPAPTLDGAILAGALAPAQRVAAENAGIELIGGAQARHCRTAVTGASALASFPPLTWLAGGPLPDSQVFGPWRGELDWWVFSDGQLGLATVHMTGRSPDPWGQVSVLGSLDARLQAIQRDQPELILPPQT